MSRERMYARLLSLLSDSLGMTAVKENTLVDFPHRFTAAKSFPLLLTLMGDSWILRHDRHVGECTSRLCLSPGDAYPECTM